MLIIGASSVSCDSTADGAGTRLPATIVPEISQAQRRLTRAAARHGTDAAVRAYDIARRYLWEDWRTGGGRPIWYDPLGERWYDRADTAASSQSSALPWWAVQTECAALAAMFTSPFWAELAVPAADRRHRLFYQHMLAVLGIDTTGGRGARPQFGDSGPSRKTSASRRAGAACSATPSGARRSRLTGLRARSRSSTSPKATSAPPSGTVWLEEGRQGSGYEEAKA
jgi:hypothetical protein